jgi:hypothetical protein
MPAAVESIVQKAVEDEFRRNPKIIFFSLLSFLPLNNR